MEFVHVFPAQKLGNATCLAKWRVSLAILNRWTHGRRVGDGAVAQDHAMTYLYH